MLLLCLSALTLLVGRQEGHPACKKTEWWGAGVVICLEQSADLHTAQLMPLPLTVSCFSKIQIGFTFLVLAHLGSPGKEPLNGCVCAAARYAVTANMQVLFMFYQESLQHLAHDQNTNILGQWTVIWCVSWKSQLTNDCRQHSCYNNYHPNITRMQYTISQSITPIHSS